MTHFWRNNQVFGVICRWLVASSHSGEFPGARIMPAGHAEGAAWLWFPDESLEGRRLLFDVCAALSLVPALHTTFPTRELLQAVRRAIGDGRIVVLQRDV